MNDTYPQRCSFVRIAVDARVLQEKVSGIKHYAYYLLKDLKKIDHEDEFLLYISDVRNLPAQGGNIERRLVKARPWFLGLHFQMKRDRVEVFHSFAPTLPFIKNCITVITVHDLSFRVCPRWFPTVIYLRLCAFVRLAIMMSDMIIAISENTKRDIIRYYGVAEEKIKVIYYGVEHGIFKPISDNTIMESARQKYGIKGRFMLYVGDINTRKNTFRLLEAFHRFKKQHDTPHKLVLAGKKFGVHSDIEGIVSSLSLERDVILLGFIEQHDLPPLYNAADLLIYPSLYEGFGLPPLEAMACGTPVITSNTSSLPEVVGDAGITVDPTDVNSLAEAMFNIISDDGLRLELRRKGVERAKTFGWDRAARETLEVYKKVYEKRS